LVGKPAVWPRHRKPHNEAKNLPLATEGFETHNRRESSLHHHSQQANPHTAKSEQILMHLATNGSVLRDHQPIRCWCSWCIRSSIFHETRQVGHPSH
jgi:hypothetical protein